MVVWQHRFEDEPVELWSEIDESGFEVRKVERFRRGTLGFAGPNGNSENTHLSDSAMPSPAEIGLDPQFQATAINPTEFEQVWKSATLAAAA
jgi:hypothetical protein